MKLIYLSMKNIGAFNGETGIDFSSLSDIFLISGNTGSGKTTIFDSVVFALYGKLPGSRSSLEIRRFRSDFSNSGEEASVSLVFSVNQDRYKIYRCLPVQYTKRDGTTGYKTADPVFYKKIEKLNELDFTGKEEWTIIADSSDSIKEKIENLVGLNCDEFSRIVLLPQGEFADFLKLNSGDRKDALSKLFPIGLFSSIIEAVKNKSSIFSSDINSLSQRIEDLKHSISSDEQFLEGTLQKEISELKQQKIRFTEEFNSTVEEKQKNETILSEIESRKEYEKKHEILISNKHEIEQSTERVKKARQALLLQAEIQSSAHAQKKFTENETRLLHIEEQYASAHEEHTALSGRKADFESLETDVQTINFAVIDIEEAAEAALKYRELRGTRSKEEVLLQKKVQSLEELQKELAAADEQKKAYSETAKQYSSTMDQKLELEKKFSAVNEEYTQIVLKEKYITDLFELEKTYTAEQESAARVLESITTAEKSLEDFETALDTLRMVNQASLIAQKLEEGKPCPVCGSVHHPGKAQKQENTSDLEQKIEARKTVINSARNDLSHMQSRIWNYSGQIQSLKNNASQIHTELSKAESEEKKETIRQQLDECNSLIAIQKKAETQIDVLEKKLQLLHNQISLLISDCNGIEKKLGLIEQDERRCIESFEKRIKAHKELLQKTVPQMEDSSIISFPPGITGILKELSSDYSRKITAFKQKLKESEEKMTVLETQKKEIEAALSISLTEKNEESAKLERSLRQTDFKTEEEAMNAYLEEKMIADLEKNIAAWNEETISLASLIETSKQKYPYTYSSIQNQTDLCNKKYNDLKNRIDELEKVLEEKQHRYAALENTRQQIELYNQELLTMQETGGKYLKLNMLLSSQNPKKIPLDAWVLGLYLEEITQYASKRLQRISDGRYTFLVKTEEEGGRDKIKGLDLEIFDSFTGKKRPCATLSGGETFMASISLALALTDVVQSKAGGISLDSLFIDEGFGSLDDASLEKALSILDEIREKRMVGIISHVGDLQSRIRSQIVVTKGQNGSTIKLYM